MGGLGHVAVKFGVAIGAETFVISRRTKKKESSMNDLKAFGYIDSTNTEEITSMNNTFDLIIDTVAVKHDVNALMNLLKLDGKIVLVGISPDPMP